MLMRAASLVRPSMGMRQQRKYATRNERIEVILDQVKGPLILHVGCVGVDTVNVENHWLHLQLCKSFRDAEVLGIDINSAGVHEMREMGFNVVVGDAENMDLGRRFDTIVAGELIEHLSNPGRFLEGCLRHLEPSGKLILSTPNPFAPMPCLMYLKNFTRAFNPEHTLWLCPQTLRQLAERSGFQVTETSFVDDLRPEINDSRWYRTFCHLDKLFRGFLPRRFRSTIVAVLEPRRT